MGKTAIGMDQLAGYKCVVCGGDYPPTPFRYQCGACGGNLDMLYDYDWLKQHWSRESLAQNDDASLWRFSPLLPIESLPSNRTLRVGGTPLVALPETASRLGLAKLYLKDDTRQPSGSLKDRATEVGLQHASEMGKEVLVAASTGNAAASLAALGAFYGKQTVIFAPASAPLAKLTQILQYGALLYPVDGNYDAAFDLSVEVADVYGWYLRSTGINPVLSEGKKTVALEMAEQLAWKMPDKVLVPVGDGCIIGGVHKGFTDLLQLGWIDRMPQLIAVQAAGSSAIVTAIESGQDIEPVQAQTVADSIGVDMPRDGHKALRAIRDSEGFGIQVDDQQILEAQLALSRVSGIFAEPAAAAVYAALMQAIDDGSIGPQESVIVLLTGSGLKDIPAAQKLVHVPEAMAPDVARFQAFYEQETAGRVQA